jgi:hypothetical protein
VRNKQLQLCEKDTIRIDQHTRLSPDSVRSARAA